MNWLELRGSGGRECEVESLGTVLARMLHHPLHALLFSRHVPSVRTFSSSLVCAPLD